MEMRVAAIDLGTVSSRLSLATVRDGVIASLEKRTVITDLGEGVDATGRLSDAAVGRVLAACEGFREQIGSFGPRATCTTLTSAARDAENGGELLDGLRSLGLEPQIIPGEVEARLTFYGVAHDFMDERIVVADSGGGSTELALGRYGARGEGDAAELALDAARSLDVGCRRVTERFFSALPPAVGEVDRAAAWARGVFEPCWRELGVRGGEPVRLVAVGGTVTTLVAMLKEMAVYDSSLVHLERLGLDEVEGAVDRLARLSADQIAALPGIQPKRAPVILGGAVIIRELMRSGGFAELTVSENSLLAGMAATMFEALSGEGTAIGWEPRFSR